MGTSNIIIARPVGKDKLESLKAFLKALKIKFEITEEKDWFDELTFEQKKSIEKGRTDLKAGRVVSHEDVKKQVRELIESKKSA